MREFAEREVTQTKRIETGATCDRCNRELKPVQVMIDEPPREDTHGMYDDASRVTMDGWYGGYIDPMGRGPAFDLCRRCSDQFVQEFLGLTLDAFWELRENRR